MTPEEAYDETLCRIREVKETRALELDFSGLALTPLPPELERLTSLRSPNLFLCEQLSGDLSPLASLAALQQTAANIIFAAPVMLKSYSMAEQELACDVANH
jgi:hypothetical protein